MGRSPTFLVGAERQRTILDEFQKRGQHLSEAYQKNKPLCFVGNAFQKTHPQKAVPGHRDADATMVSPVLLGVADGVSQIEEFGMDASELPNELLRACEELALDQLIPDNAMRTGRYTGPTQLMREAYEATESLGSTTVLLAIMDNSTLIHSRLHPMIAILSIGDCELLVLRRPQSPQEPPVLQAVFHTEMQRIDGHAQSPLQVARVDDKVDPDFDESLAIEVIERGSAVHCLSAYEGDILVMGSDGVFDNMFIDEIVTFCNEMLPPRPPNTPFEATSPTRLYEVARRIVAESHAKTTRLPNGRFPETPIGQGGKMDDTCCVVGEVVEWTEADREKWQMVRGRRWHNSMFTCGGCNAEDSADSQDEGMAHRSERSRGIKAAHYDSESSGSEEEQAACKIL